MSASLEAEQKAKGEALRVKKALEGEINELEIGLDHANKANSEGLKSVKRYQAQLKETIQLYEDEARSRSQIMEQVGISFLVNFHFYLIETLTFLQCFHFHF